MQGMRYQMRIADTFCLILGGCLTTKTNPKIEASAQNMKTSESASFTHFPSQISATQPDTQNLEDSYTEDGNVTVASF